MKHTHCRSIARKKRQSGQAILEFALILPLLFPLVLAIFDFGMYAYAFISVQNAARVGAMRNSGGLDSAADQPSACSMAIDELRGLPNIGGSFQSPCVDAPLLVTSVLCTGTGPCAGSQTSADGQPATAVTVSYTMPGVFRFPIVGPSTIARTSEMKIRSIQ